MRVFGDATSQPSSTLNNVDERRLQYVDEDNPRRRGSSRSASRGGSQSRSRSVVSNRHTSRDRSRSKTREAYRGRSQSKIKKKTRGDSRSPEYKTNSQVSQNRLGQWDIQPRQHRAALSYRQALIRSSHSHTNQKALESTPVTSEEGSTDNIMDTEHFPVLRQTDSNADWSINTTANGNGESLPRKSKLAQETAPSLADEFVQFRQESEKRFDLILRRLTELTVPTPPPPSPAVSEEVVALTNAVSKSTKQVEYLVTRISKLEGELSSIKRAGSSRPRKYPATSGYVNNDE